MRHVRVDEHVGQRLDNFLLRYLRNVPKSRVYRMIRKGEVRVNSRRANASYRLASGDEVRIPPVQLRKREDAKVPDAFRDFVCKCVIAKDDDLIVVDKPAGIAVHGGTGIEMSLMDALKTLFDEVELVHRLDRDTSGCLLIARSRATLLNLHQALRENQLKKRYVAMVNGPWNSEVRQLEQRLFRYSLRSGERRVRVSPNGQSAMTRVSVAKSGSRLTQLHVNPITGRTHQIRVHLAYQGHPILGDLKYADDMVADMSTRLMLHAEEIGLPDGRTYQARLPVDFEETWTKFEGAD